MRHKILGNVFFGIMAVFLVCVIVIISAVHELYQLSVVTIIMDLKYQLVVVFLVSVVLSVVLSKLLCRKKICGKQKICLPQSWQKNGGSART